MTAANNETRENYLGKLDLLAVLVLVVLQLVFSIHRLVPGVVGTFQDDAVYLSTGQSLAEGNGYRLNYLPENPLQTKYPPLYPLMLSAIWKISPAFPANVIWMQALTIFSSLIFISAAFYLLRKSIQLSLLGSVIVSGLLISDDLLLFFSTNLLTEIPFGALILLSLIFYRRFASGANQNNTRQLLIGGLLGLPFLCRVIGITLPISIALIRYKEKRPISRILLGALLIVLPWILWAKFQQGSWGQNLVSNYQTNYVGWWSMMTEEGFSRVIFKNFLLTVVSIGSKFTAGIEQLLVAQFSELKKTPPLLQFINLGLGVCTLTLLFTWRGKQHLAVRAFLVAYLSLIIVWPWAPNRFLYPVLPLLLSFLPAFFERKAMFAFYLLLAVSIAGNFKSSWKVAEEIQRTQFPSAEAPTDFVWGDFERLFTWIETNTSESALLATPFDATFSLYTGRKSFRPYLLRPMSAFYGLPGRMSGPLTDIERALDAYHPDYFVTTPLPGYFEEKEILNLPAELETNRPGFLEKVFQGSNKAFSVYKLNWSASKSTHD